MTNSKEDIYREIDEAILHNVATFIEKRDENIFLVKGKLFEKAILVLPPHLDSKNAPVPLSSIYTVFFHKQTRGLVVMSKGASLLTRSVLSGRYMVIRHIGFTVYLPNQGIEIIDVGVAGDLQGSKSVVLRPESACSPGFMFGSQRCNCYDQWTLSNELAFEFNAIEKPNLRPVELEDFLTSSMFIDVDENLVSKREGQAFIMAHFTSQNGMGSGVIENEFVSDLTANAFIRHRGEYSAEQIYKTSVAGGFETIGITPDPRKLNNGLSFKLMSAVLDYLKAPKKIIALTNNTDKISALKESGYDVKRIQLIARAGDGCEIEIDDRRNEFKHMIPENIITSWAEELPRIKDQIINITSENERPS